MKNILQLLTVAAVAFGTIQLSTLSPLRAEMKTHGSGNFMKKGMHISAPWTTPTTAEEKSNSVFMTIMNHRRDDVVLTEVKTEIAEKAVFHKVVMHEGKPTMEPLTAGLALAKHQIIKLEPGGLHLMLMGLKKPLVDGTEIPMTLVFDKAGPIEIMVKISKTATAPRGSHSSGDKKEMRGSHKAGDKAKAGAKPDAKADAKKDMRGSH